MYIYAIITTPCSIVLSHIFLSQQYCYEGVAQPAFRAERNLRDQELFFTGIDTMLCGSDLLRLKANNISDNNYNIKEETTISQMKTNEGNLVMMPDPTREVLRQLINQDNKGRSKDLFTRLNKGQNTTSEQRSAAV